MPGFLIPLAAAAIASTATAAGQASAARKANRRAEEEAKIGRKETKRETRAAMLRDKFERDLEAEEQGRKRKKKTLTSRAQGMEETANLIREALKI